MFNFSVSSSCHQYIQHQSLQEVVSNNTCSFCLLSGSSREVKAPAEVSEQMVHKLRGKNEFTVLVTLKQDHLNSGVILSIHHSEHR